MIIFDLSFKDFLVTIEGIGCNMVRVEVGRLGKRLLR